MLRGVASVLEKHHRVQTARRGDRGGGEAVAPLHPRAPVARQGGEPARHRLRAGGRVSQHAMPPEVEDCQRRIEALEVESDIIGREEAIGIDVSKRSAQVQASLAESNRRARQAQCALEGRERRWSTGCSTLRAQAARGQAGAAWTQADRPRGQGRPRRAARGAARAADADQHAAGRDAADPALGRLPGRRSVVADWTGIPVGRMAAQRDRDRAQAAEAAGPARDRPGPRDGDDRQAHPDLARGPGQPEQADRRVHAGRHLRRGQDRDRDRAGRGALRRRAEHDRHQHERVPGGAHRELAQGRAARLRGLRRRRRADRGGAPPALQRGAARRGREGALRRARALLPGVRQGLHGRRRGPQHRLQEHADPADHQRRHRHDRQHVQGPGADARARGHGQGAARAAA